MSPKVKCYTRNLTNIRLHASDSLNFSNFWIIETHEEESDNLIELKGYLQAVVLP